MGIKIRNPVLCSLTIEGFKAHFEPQKLELRPLTVLAGANSSGKSSAMQALLLLKQTIDAMPLDTGGLKLDRPNVQYTNAAQFLSHEPGKGGTRKEFSLTLGYSDSTALGVTFRKAAHAVEVASTTYSRGKTSIKLEKSEKPSAHLPQVLPELKLADLKEPPSRWASFLIPRLSFALLEDGFSVSMPHIVTQTSQVLQSLMHIPGSRGNPLRSFPRTVVGYESPGVFTDLAPAILAEWTSKKGQELEMVNESLDSLGITWKAEATVVDAASIEVRVARTPRPARGRAHDMVNIADVGFGVSQVLPIVVALIAAKADQLLYIEQPEIHLHPRAVMALADLIADASRRGVRCIIETHSDVLLRRLQWNIAREDTPLAHTDAVFHWFSRDEHGHTKVASVTPDASGAYGDWPVDFAELDAQNAREYIAAAEKHLPEEE